MANAGHPLLRPSSKTLIVEGGRVFVRGHEQLADPVKREIARLLDEAGAAAAVEGDALVVPLRVGGRNLAALLGRCIQPMGRRRLAIERIRGAARPRAYPIAIDFAEVDARARAFAGVIEARGAALREVLLRYESAHVAADETARTLDLLRSLEENRAYFVRRIGDVVTFLPGNQPLYALACFALVPSFLAARVHVRAPRAMDGFFEELLACLDVLAHFPNLAPSRQSRQEFVRERARARPDAVIFTGTHKNAEAVRRAFDRDVLVIVNGAGHNPIVVTESADLGRAVTSILRVQLYNQGQDCANASAILVHRAREAELLGALRAALARVEIGPLNRREHLRRIQEILLENAAWLDPATEGVIRTRSGVVEPTIVARPLACGGNYVESFAPILFVQRYDDDRALAAYFEDPRYALHAMYVTVFGHSPYVDSLGSRPLAGGRVLHDEGTILRDTDLHAPGVERGTRPYGGYGRGASCLSLHGVITPGPTLPQRDLFEQLVLPSLRGARS